MAVFVRTSQPRTLLSAIKANIDSGHIDTWEYDSDGDFTHKPPQWRKKAWLRPVVSEGMLAFGIVYPTTVTAKSKEVYAVYHGRYIEMLLAHFDEAFKDATASAKLVSPDRL